MPHLVILYTPNIALRTDLDQLCKTLAATMVALKDETNQPVFPKGGVRVFALPAAYSAVADSSGDFGFIYLNIRMAKGRSDFVKQAVGNSLTQAARSHLAPLLAAHRVGLTLQVDEGHEVFDAKFGNLHPLFAPA